MTPSAQALHEFVATHSEPAFQTLVERHLNLVFNTARRIGGGDTHFAEDVAQVVFRDLARKAHRIPSSAPLEGWLYRHTSFTALRMLRTERRRGLREEQAMHLHEEPSSSEAREEVEAALARLGEQDREALVLRYIESWDWRAIGATLGISEDAAQKRASRALDKLRSILKTGGAELSASAAIALLASLSVAAPPALASDISKAALAPVSASILTAMKSHLLTVACAGLVATAPLLYQRSQIARLRDENRQLGQSLADLRNAPKAEEHPDLERLRRENAELHRLRAEVTALRQQPPSAPPETAEMKPVEIPFRPIQVAISAQFAEVPDAALEALQTGGFSVPPEAGLAILDGEQARELKSFLEQREGVDLLSAPRVSTIDGRQARIAIEDTVMLNGQAVPFGPVLDALPTVAPDKSSTSLQLNATLTEFLGVSETSGANAPLPRFRVRQVSSEAVIRQGDLVVMRAGAKRNQDGSIPDAPKKLLVLISSTLINPDGTTMEPN